MKLKHTQAVKHSTITCHANLTLNNWSLIMTVIFLIWCNWTWHRSDMWTRKKDYIMIIMRCCMYVNWYNIEKIISYTCVSWSAYKVGSSLMFCWVMNDVQISSFDYIIIFLYSVMIIYINWASHMLHHKSIYLLVFSRKKQVE